MNYDYLSTLVPFLSSTNDQMTRHIDRRTFAAIEENGRQRNAVKGKRELEKRIQAMRAAFASASETSVASECTFVFSAIVFLLSFV